MTIVETGSKSACSQAELAVVIMNFLLAMFQELKRVVDRLTIQWNLYVMDTLGPVHFSYFFP